MILLPVLWGQEPTAADWGRLRAARVAVGHDGLVKLVRALPGSPNRILAVGATPGWLCEYDQIDSTEDPRLEQVLSWCLYRIENPFAPDMADQLSAWMGATVTQIGEEDHGSVRFDVG